MPNTVNRTLNIPNTGDLSGSWGTAAVNANMNGIDGMFGGVQAISISTASLTLTKGTGSVSASGGPTQSDNAVLKFSGTLTADRTVTFPCPGFWIVRNDCAGAFALIMRAAGTGNVIGLPPGEASHIYNDGANCEFVDMGRVGSFMRLCVSTTPAWMNACTVLPYLPCLGTAVYTASVYPALANMLGSTFGGNGITTFGVPDKSNRVGVPLGTRITTTIAGFDGNTLGAAGGTATITLGTPHLPASIPYTDPMHTHEIINGTSVWRGAGGGTFSGSLVLIGGYNLAIASALVGITINPGSPNTPLSNVQPTLVDGIEFIKT